MDTGDWQLPLRKKEEEEEEAVVVILKHSPLVSSHCYEMGEQMAAEMDLGRLEGER